MNGSEHENCIPFVLGLCSICTDFYKMLLPHFKGALTQNFSGEIMSEIDLSERTNLWNIKGKYSIGHIQNKVRHMPRDWARQTRLRRIQCGSHVNKPIAWVYIGWLLAHVLCYCAVCATCGIFLRVSDCVCTARQCGAPSSMVFPRPFCVLTWPAVFTLPAKLLLPNSVLFETETVTGRSKNRSE